MEVCRPGFFSPENLVDMCVANLPVLLIGLGMTLVVLTGQDRHLGGIDLCVCSVVTGVSARMGAHGWSSGWIACAAGAAFGALNGKLVAYSGIPSIVVTLATMIALQDGLRWLTQDSWIDNLPEDFHWMGGSQQMYTA